MKQNTLLRIAGSIWLSVAWLAAGCDCACSDKGAGVKPQAANSAAAPAQAPDKDGWKPLFDGKTLKGWKVTDFGGQGAVKAEEGKMVLSMGQPLTGITWAGEFPKTDYEVSFSASRVEGNDFFVGFTFPVGPTHCSLVMGGWGGSVTGLSSINGLDASENQTTQFMQYAKGKTYPVKVRVTAEKITVWVEDKQIIEQEIKDQKVSTRVEMEESKPLGFCTYSTTGAIWDLKMRKLPAGK